MFSVSYAFSPAFPLPAKVQVLRILTPQAQPLLVLELIYIKSYQQVLEFCCLEGASLFI